MAEAVLVDAVRSATWAALRSCEPLADHVAPVLGPSRRRSGYRHVKQFVFNTGIEIRTGDEPCYHRPPLDRIEIPEARRFFDQRTRWACCLHELLHATEWRCGWHGGPAACELRAEVGTIIFQHRLGLDFCADPTNYRRWIGEWRSLYLADMAALARLVADTFEGVEHLLWLEKVHCTRRRRHPNQGDACDVEPEPTAKRDNCENHRRYREQKPSTVATALGHGPLFRSSLERPRPGLFRD
jgi:antirestriction protein ArdC